MTTQPASATGPVEQDRPVDAAPSLAPVRSAASVAVGDTLPAVTVHLDRARLRHLSRDLAVAGLGEPLLEHLP